MQVLIPMSSWKRLVWVVILTAIGLFPVLLVANGGGYWEARTGSFNEPGCNGLGCHTPIPLPPNQGRVVIDVGPYVPGEKQLVVVTIADASAARWGFQLAAREARNPQRQAGTFSAPPNDVLEDGSTGLVQVRCSGGAMPPCGGQIEFATHTSIGSRRGQRSGSVEFRVDWTAPPGDVGDVILAASAVAGDGDGGFGGDQSYTTNAISFYAPSSRPSFREGGVVSAASFRTTGGAIGHGSLVTLFGDGLAGRGFSRQVSRLDLNLGRLPNELGRIGADFFFPSSDPYPAYMLFLNERQMNVQVPELPSSYVGQIEVQPVFNRGQGRNEVRGNRVRVNLQPLAPALFTYPDGRSVAAVHSAAPSGAPVGPPGLFPNSRPARAGDIVLIYGTGFGPTRPAVDPGSLASEAAPLVAQTGISIGGLRLAPADILYAGAAPGYAGLIQINVRVPAGLGSGDLPVIATVGGVETQPGVTLRVE